MSDYGGPKLPGSALLGRLRRPGKKAKKPELIVVGLGNPGPEYAATRHNTGFWAIDDLSDRHHLPLPDRRRSCVLGEGAIDGRPVVLAKPRTYVNESGRAVRYLLDRYRLGADRLLIVYDDMDLPPGRLRLKASGGPGGHNGMKSVAEAVGDGVFPRLRIGVGRPGGGEGDVPYVLGTPTEPERRLIEDAVTRVSQVIAAILSDGMERTMDWANRG